MVKSIQSLMLQSLPTVPVKSKWLQTGPCVDWFVLLNTMSVLQLWWPHAFGKCKGAGNTSAGYFEDLGYQELAGKRLQAGEEERN